MTHRPNVHHRPIGDQKIRNQLLYNPYHMTSFAVHCVVTVQNDVVSVKRVINRGLGLEIGLVRSGLVLHL